MKKYIDQVFIAALLLLISFGLNGQIPNKYTDLQEALKFKNDVIWLDLHSQNLNEIPDTFDAFPNLKYLDLSGNNISRLPESLNGFSNLEMLNLSGNPIVILPPSFTKLKKLKSLQVANNPTFNLEENMQILSQMVGLETLDLHNDGISQLPTDFGHKLETLEFLDLSGNPIEVLPQTFNNLKRLRILYLNNDPFFQLNENIGILSKIRSLEELHLENNNFDDVSTLKDLPNVEYLFISENNIRDLPDFQKMKKLKYVDLSENRLEPSDISTFNSILNPSFIINFGKIK